MNAPSINIAGRMIGPGHAPYVIAEMSANHNGSLDTARHIVAEAARAGADAVKIQTYTADTITLKSDAEDFRIRGGLGDGEKMGRASCRERVCQCVEISVVAGSLKKKDKEIRKIKK